MIRTGLDRIAVRPAGRAPGSARRAAAAAICALRCSRCVLSVIVRTEHSGAHRSMRSRATWRQMSQPVRLIGMPKLWA